MGARTINLKHPLCHGFRRESTELLSGYLGQIAGVHRVREYPPNRYRKLARAAWWHQHSPARLHQLRNTTHPGGHYRNVASHCRKHRRSETLRQRAEHEYVCADEGGVRVRKLTCEMHAFSQLETCYLLLQGAPQRSLSNHHPVKVGQVPDQ